MATSPALRIIARMRCGPNPPGPILRAGFTLIELVVVVSIIVVLLSLLLPAVSLVRQGANRQQATQVVRQLAAGLRTYALGDDRHRFPLHGRLYPAASITMPQPLSLQPFGGADVGILALLVAVHAGVEGGRSLDEAGRMIDPWGQPYCYQLLRPAPAANAALLADWNWDREAARPAAWNAVADLPGPFPYVWSYGRGGTPSDARTWIHEPGN